jgi:hypothetical protein
MEEQIRNSETWLAFINLSSRKMKLKLIRIRLTIHGVSSRRVQRHNTSLC